MARERAAGALRRFPNASQPDLPSRYYMSSSPAHPTRSWVVRFAPIRSAAIRLFAFPHAGAGASVFREWPRAAPPWIDVLAVQLPGRENRLSEEAHSRMSTLIEELARGIVDHLDLPYAFFGHSMGALVCFELATYLRDQYGTVPQHLFVSAHRAPHMGRLGSNMNDFSDAHLLDELRDLEGTSQTILRDRDLMELLLPTLRSDFSIVATYDAAGRQPLTCPISAYGGIQDKRVTLEELKAWQSWTVGEFTLRRFPGGHFFLVSARDVLVQTIAQELKLGSTSPDWM
ncbi:MAG: thioesterase II family protein [Candidatus Dormibacteraceae bacterium]